MRVKHAGDLPFPGDCYRHVYSEHGVPHLHAVYGEFKMTVELESRAIHGEFPVRAQRLVLEWMQLHQQELLENWHGARQRQPLQRIDPLE